MNSKDLSNIIKQRYGKMSENDKEVIRDIFYSETTGPVLRRFMGGSIANTFKLKKPKKMRMGSVVAKAPRVIGGYDPNAKPKETIADDKPFEGQDGDYIINAAAVEFAGKQDIEKMVDGALKNLQEKGVDVEFGNPKINIRDRVKLLLSQNEVYIPKVIAKEIGYDRLEKINNRGKRRTKEIQEQTQSAYMGGAVGMFEGSEVKKADATLNTILKFFGFNQGPTESEIRSKEQMKRRQQLTKKDQGFALKPPAMPKDMRAKRDDDNELFELATQAVNAQEGSIKTEGYIPQYKSGKVIGASGVTIGRGVDLGQHTVASLKKANFSEDIIEKFKPYLGLKREQAKTALKKNPLSISQEDAKYISDMMLYSKIDDYNRIYKKLGNVPDNRIKAVLVAEHFSGRLGRKQYNKFKDILVKSNFNLEKAYEEGVFKNKDIVGTVFRNAGKNLLGWYFGGGGPKTAPDPVETYDTIPEKKPKTIKELPKPKPKIKEKETMPIPFPKNDGFIKRDKLGYPTTDQGFRV